MAKLTIAVFLLVVVAQTLLAQPVVDENVDSVADVFGAGDVVDTDEIGAPSDGGDDELPDEDLSDDEDLSGDEVEQALEEVLSRVRRGLSSRVRQPWTRCRRVCGIYRCVRKCRR